MVTIPFGNLTDRDLVLATQGGDRSAFDVLVERYQALMRALAARYLRTSDDVFDVIQEAFLDAYNELDAFDPKRDFSAWLRGICRHKVVDSLRRQAAQRRRHLALVDRAIAEQAGSDDQDDAAACERVRVLRDCVHRLRPEHRVLLRRRYEGMTPVKDLARKEGKTPASVAMRLKRIRHVLQRCLQEKIPEAAV